MSKKPLGKVPPPLVSFREEEAGRETLSAIARERSEAQAAHRNPAKTKHYGDRISNAPGAVSPKVARAMDTAPEVSVSLRSAGRETYALIHREHREEVPDIEVTTDSDAQLDEDDYLDTLEVEQVHTFLVRAPLEDFLSRKQRLRLVERRLLRHMQGATLDDVTHIEVESGAADGGTIVRVYTRMID